MRRLIIAILAAAATLAAFMGPSTPAQAAEPGSAYVTLFSESEACGTTGSLRCTSGYVKVNPAGWYKNRYIEYLYTFKIDGNVDSTDSDKCWYTGGDSCTRYSKEFSDIKQWSDSHKYCIVTRIEQKVNPIDWATDKYRRCWWTGSGGAARTAAR